MAPTAENGGRTTASTGRNDGETMTIYSDDGADSAKKNERADVRSGDLPLAGWLVTAGVGSLLPVCSLLVAGGDYYLLLRDVAMG